MAVGPFRLVLAAASALLLAAGIAHADAPDDQFMALLAKDGIPGAPEQMIPIAHERCDDADLPRTGLFIPRFGAQPGPYNAAIGKVYTELENQGLTSGQAAQFIRDAIKVYCPDQAGS
jgi:Protein of unknown function (DUF732)